jgi:hypothetical protein
MFRQEASWNQSTTTVEGAMDKQNNRDMWFGRFIKALTDQCGHDPICVRIASDRKFGRKIASGVRLYVDERFSWFFYSSRKARMAAVERIAEQAVEGVEFLSSLYALHDPEEAARMNTVAARLRGLRRGARKLQQTKRCGRDRYHGLLHRVHRELKSHLKQTVTYATLANVINAGFRADGRDIEVAEESIRKNLTAFRKANPHWNPAPESKTP